jgi:hypothetical protein
MFAVPVYTRKLKLCLPVHRKFLGGFFMPSACAQELGVFGAARVLVEALNQAWRNATEDNTTNKDHHPKSVELILRLGRLLSQSGLVLIPTQPASAFLQSAEWSEDQRLLVLGFVYSQFFHRFRKDGANMCVACSAHARSFIEDAHLLMCGSGETIEHARRSGRLGIALA